MEKLLLLKYDDKQNWTGLSFISVENLFLDQDWNRFDIINDISSTINELSSLKYNLLSGILSTYIVKAFSSTFPCYLSSINYITGFYQTKISGFSTISFDGNILNLEENYYLPSTEHEIDFVNVFNNLTGKINIITSITINNQIVPIDNYNAELGDYIDYDLQQIILSVNGQGGNVKIIQQVVINDVDNKEITLDNRLRINLSSNFYKKDLSFSNAKIPSSNEENAIVNLEMFNNVFQTSKKILAGQTVAIPNVIDWICITNSMYKKIEPSFATLRNGTLTIQTNEDAIIYFIKLKNQGVV